VTPTTPAKAPSETFACQRDEISLRVEVEHTEVAVWKNATSARLPSGRIDILNGRLAKTDPNVDGESTRPPLTSLGFHP
jgi:hypothetical protein